MKATRLLPLLMAWLLVAHIAQAQTNIPDANFAAAIRTACPTCIDGSNNLTAAAASLTSLTVSGKSISNLSGIEGFTGLTYLDCASNNLTSLPLLPASLQTFYCSINNLTSLPPLPLSLKTFSCSTNQITELPALPAGLITLWCRVNKLTSLPTLPNSLQDLRCHDNLLTSLPALPSSLTILQCQNNKITCLGNTPLRLTELRLDNTISCLPSGSVITTLKNQTGSVFTLLFCDSFTLNAGTTASKSVLCAGNSATFSASATSSGTAPMSVKLQRKRSTDADFVDVQTLAYTSGNTANLTATAALADNNAQYRAVFTGAACAVSAPAVTIQVFAAPATPTINYTSPVCVGSTLALSSGGTGSFSWAGPNGFRSSVQNPQLSDYSTAMNGLYNLTVTGGVCTGTATVSIVGVSCSSTTTTTTSISTTVPPTTTPPSNTGTCEVSITNKFPNPNAGGKILLSVSPTAQTAYTWKGPDSFTSTTANVALYSVQTSQAGVYSVTVTNTNSCTTSATIQVTIGGVTTGPTTPPPTPPSNPTPPSSTPANPNTPLSPTSPNNPSNPNAPDVPVNNAIMGLKMDVENRTPAPNSTLRYAVLVLNKSTTTAMGPVSVSNVLPQGLTFVRATLGSVSNNNGTLTLTAPSVPADDFVLWLFEVQVTGTGKITNTISSTYNGSTLTASLDINVGTSSRLGTGEDTGMEMEVKAYPNPTSGKVWVEVRLAEASALTLQCLDLQGRTLFTTIHPEELTQHHAEIDMSTWSKGMYIINAQSNTKSQSKKIVKE